MPLLIEQRILAGRLVDAEEMWMKPGDTKKSSARGGKTTGKMDCKCSRTRGSSRDLCVKKMKGTEQ